MDTTPTGAPPPTADGGAPPPDVGMAGAAPPQPPIPPPNSAMQPPAMGGPPMPPPGMQPQAAMGGPPMPPPGMHQQPGAGPPMPPPGMGGIGHMMPPPGMGGPYGATYGGVHGMPGGPPMPPPGMMGAPPMPPPPGQEQLMQPEMAGNNGMDVAEAPQAAPQPPPQPQRDLPPLVMEEPSNTLYLNNLDERIKEKKLKESLTAVFDQFGKILQIVAMKSIKRRGQAFVVFDELESAVKAVEQMQNFPFFDRPLRINFAKTKSDVIAKREGTFQPRVKPPKPPRKRKAPAPTKPELKPKKRAKKQPSAPLQPAQDMSYMEELPPNNILFATEMPAEVEEARLGQLFSQFPGFREVRRVPGRHDIAFVEYADEMSAGNALMHLRGQKLTDTHSLRINFSKK